MTAKSLWCLCLICLAVLGAGCDSSAGERFALPDTDTSEATDVNTDLDDDDAEVTPLDDVSEEVTWYDVDDDFEVIEYDAEQDFGASDADVVDAADSEADALDATEEDDVVAPPEPPEDEDPDDPVVRTTTFGVLHWNIAGGKENDCKTDGIRRAVMRAIKNAPTSVDFVSLNEVCRAQYDAIQAALKAYWNKTNNDKFSAFQSSNARNRGIAMFSRRNIEDVTRTQVGEDQYGKRFLLCGRQVDRRVRVCTTHLTPGDARARTQATHVLNRIEAFWANKRDTVIIGGDFNIQPNNHGLNKFYAPGADTPNNPDNHGRFRELDDNDSSNCRGYGERTTLASTGGPCNKGRKIDFIFVRGNRIVNGNYGADSLDIPDDCTGRCSDHRAVRGRVKIRFRVD